MPHSPDTGSYPRNDLFCYFRLCTVWWPLSAPIDLHIITLIITKHLPFQNQIVLLVCQIHKMKYYHKYTALIYKYTQKHQIVHTFSADLIWQKNQTAIDIFTKMFSIKSMEVYHKPLGQKSNHCYYVLQQKRYFRYDFLPIARLYNRIQHGITKNSPLLSSLSSWIHIIAQYPLPASRLPVTKTDPLCPKV